MPAELRVPDALYTPDSSISHYWAWTPKQPERHCKKQQTAVVVNLLTVVGGLLIGVERSTNDLACDAVVGTVPLVGWGF